MTPKELAEKIMDMDWGCGCCASSDMPDSNVKAIESLLVEALSESYAKGQSEHSTYCEEKYLAAIAEAKRGGVMADASHDAE